MLFVTTLLDAPAADSIHFTVNVSIYSHNAPVYVTKSIFFCVSLLFFFPQQSISAATSMTHRKERWEEFPFSTTKKWLCSVARTTVQKGTREKWKSIHSRYPSSSHLFYFSNVRHKVQRSWKHWRWWKGASSSVADLMLLVTDMKRSLMCKIVNSTMYRRRNVIIKLQSHKAVCDFCH